MRSTTSTLGRLLGGTARSFRLLREPRKALVVAAALAVGSVGTSCGGGGGSSFSVQAMSLVDFLIVDRALQPAAPTGSVNVPRNAQLLMRFSEQILPQSVSFQTIQVRTGNSFQSIPGGSFRVNGSQAIYDPTIDQDGTPRPFGLAPLQQYSLDIPSIDIQPGVVRNLDNDPNLVTFFTTFTTAEGYLRELVPPEVLDVFFLPAPDPVTRNIPGNGIMGIRFNEVMDPAAFQLAPPAGPGPTTGVDVRYTNAAINVANNFQNRPVSGSFTHDASATTFFFRPTFSFGNAKLIFTVAVFQALRDLSGNLLINPQSWGPFICDGEGLEAGDLLVQDFTTDTIADRDASSSTADWGVASPGVLRGLPVISRDVLIFGADFDAQSDYSGEGFESALVGGPHAPLQGNAVVGGRGMYVPMDAPLTGLNRNNFTPTPNPASSLGRRALQSYSDKEIGQGGSITAVAFGPDSNALFASSYTDVRLRFGYQKNASLSLAASFSGNYSGSPTLVYQGGYQVVQAANIGNYAGTLSPATTAVGAINPCNVGWNQPLYNFTGFHSWPPLTSFFEWTPGTGDLNDSIMLFDMSVNEGTTFQQVRAWWGIRYPCAGLAFGAGSFIGGFPTRWMLAGAEEDSPNPAECLTCPTNAIKNPDHILIDTKFTVTRRISTGQTLFYSPQSYVPFQAAGGATFGENTNYLPPIMDPAFQSGGAQVVIEFQAANFVENNRRTISGGSIFVDWTRTINDCDGFPFFRWRVQLISNLISGKVASLNSVRIPMLLE